MFLKQMILATHVLNPYQGKTFWGFIIEWFIRLKQLITFEISLDQLVVDEIQILTLSAIALSSALVGTFLVLRRMTMLANSLSHTILLGIVFAYFLNSSFLLNEGATMPSMGLMLLGAVGVGLLTTFLTEFLTHSVGIPEDASVGLSFTSLFALSIILVTILLKDAHIGIEAVMGNADALHKNDLFWVYLIALGNIALCYLCYKEYQITTFDAAFASALGISPVIFNYLLMTQVAVTTVSSFRAVGVILVLAFMTGPVLSARMLSHRLPWILLLSSGIGVLASLFGVALTSHMMTVYGIALSTSGMVVTLLFVVTTFIMIVKYHKTRQRKKKPA